MIYMDKGTRVILIFEKDGNIRDHYRYDAFGKPAPGNTKLSSDGANVLHNTYGYTGEMWDEESNLLYLRARYYEPETGRFLSRDTYAGEVENPLSRNLYAYTQNNPVNLVDPSGHRDYIYTSKNKFYIENDWGRLEFLHPDRYFAKIRGERFRANSKETVTLYYWNSFDKEFLNKTLDKLVNKANEKKTDLDRILHESVGGDLDFKLQLAKNKLYLANGLLYNRNEAGNFVWAYFLESNKVNGYISGSFAQLGSLLGPCKDMNGTPRFDESWDKAARWAGVKHYYDRNDMWWVYYAIYGGLKKP